MSDVTVVLPQDTATLVVGDTIYFVTRVGQYELTVTPAFAAPLKDARVFDLRVPNVTLAQTIPLQAYRVRVEKAKPFAVKYPKCTDREAWLLAQNLRIGPSSTLNIDETMLSLVIQDRDLQMTPINLVCKSWHATCMNDMNLWRHRVYVQEMRKLEEQKQALKQAIVTFRDAVATVSRHAPKEKRIAAIDFLRAHKALTKPDMLTHYLKLLLMLNNTTEELQEALAALEWYAFELSQEQVAQNRVQNAKTRAKVAKNGAKAAYAAAAAAGLSKSAGSPPAPDDSDDGEVEAVGERSCVEHDNELRKHAVLHD